MSKETHLSLERGTDHRYEFTILNAAETAVIDIAGWALSWMVKRKKSDADASALITKTIGSGVVISGVYNSAPAVNTQIATVTIEDTDSTALTSGLFQHELKRTDPGFETVTSYGNFYLKETVHR